MDSLVGVGSKSWIVEMVTDRVSSIGGNREYELLGMNGKKMTVNPLYVVLHPSESNCRLKLFREKVPERKT